MLRSSEVRAESFLREEVFEVVHGRAVLNVVKVFSPHPQTSSLFRIYGLISQIYTCSFSVMKAKGTRTPKPVLPIASTTENGCESWTVKKAKDRKIDAFELWCRRRLWRVP